MNDLQEKIESTIITKTFHISGMPETVWKTLDKFCRDNYGDVRWVMLKDMYEWVQQDYRFEMLYDEIQSLKAQVAELKQTEESPRRPGLPVFGQKKE